MRTNIDIDEALIAKVMCTTGARTKKAAVEEALKLLLRLEEQRRARDALKGIGWEGDLDAGREGREYLPPPR